MKRNGKWGEKYEKSEKSCTLYIGGQGYGPRGESAATRVVSSEGHEAEVRMRDSNARGVGFGVDRTSVQSEGATRDFGPISRPHVADTGRPRMRGDVVEG